MVHGELFFGGEDHVVAGVDGEVDESGEEPEGAAVYAQTVFFIPEEEDEGDGSNDTRNPCACHTQWTDVGPLNVGGFFEEGDAVNVGKVVAIQAVDIFGLLFRRRCGRAGGDRMRPGIRSSCR